MKKFFLLCFIFVLYAGLSTTRKDIGCATCSRVLYFKNGNVLRVDSISYIRVDGIEMVETFNMETKPPKKNVYRYAALDRVEYADSTINRLAKNLYK